jgi:hypothetical protein
VDVYASTFYGALSGNASTATTLQTARNINGVSFNGSADITVADSTKLPLAGGTVSGQTSFTGGGTTANVVLDKNIASPANYYNGLQLEVRATSGTAGIGLHRNGYSHVGIYHNTSNVLQFQMNAGTVTMNYDAGTLIGTGNYNSYSPTLTGTGASGTWGININGVINTTVAGGSVLIKHSVSEVDAWIFQENAANWGLYWKNAPSGQHTFGGYTSVGAELVGMSAINASGNGVATTNYVGATSAVAQWMISNFTGYIWSASTIYAATSMVVGGNLVLHAGNYSSYALPLSGGTATSVTLGVRSNNNTFGGNTTGLSGYSFPAEIRANSASPALTWHYENVATRHIALESSGALNVLNPGEAGGAVLQVGGNVVLHASNYSSYALPLSGGTLTGKVKLNSSGGWNDTQALLTVGGGGDGRIQVRHIWGKNSANDNADALWLNYGSGGNSVQIGNSGEGNNLYVAGNIYMNGYFGGNLVLNASNYSSYALPLSGGSLSGAVQIIGSTVNGTSHYQWEGATYRNPGQWTANLIVRNDNSTTGINGHQPALVLYNNNGADQTTVGLNFASAEGATGAGNAVTLAGIVAKKESAGNVGGWSAGSLNFYVKNFANRVDAMTITSAGNIGVNTSDFSEVSWASPGIKVYGSRAALVLRSSGSLATIALTASNDDSKAIHFNQTNTGALSLYQYSAGGETFSLAANGNVGIGTTSPNKKLHVVQGTATGLGTAPSAATAVLDAVSDNYIWFRNTADNASYAGLVFQDNNVGGYIVFRNYQGSVAAGSDSMIYGAYQDHIFQTGTSETINGRDERLRIASSGQVTFNSMYISSRNTSTTGNGIFFYGLNGDGSGAFNHTAIVERIWGVDDQAELLLFKGNDPDTSTIHDRVRIAATGRIVFHSTTTYQTYSDYISAAGTGNIAGSGYIYGNDLVMTGNVTAYSDERVKTNWRNVADEFITKLSEVKSGVFDRTDISLTQAGVSAQSLQQLLPEAVVINDEGELSVNYGNAALVAAIELAKEVVELKKKIQQLESQ